MQINDISSVKKLLLSQIEKYPKLQPGDILKALHQSEFGCRHFAAGREQGLKILLQEIDSLSEQRNTEDFIEPIGDDFSRVHLDIVKNHKIAATTLFQLFLLSSQFDCGDKQRFWVNLEYFHEMCISGDLPFDPIEIRKLITDYKNSGFPAVHHSEIFRQAYHPSYRVIKNDYCKLISLLGRIDKLTAKKDKITVAIDGNCTAGKTTLAKFLSKVYDCNVFHMDDFFLQPHQRTQERLSEAGGNVDYERFYSEIIKPLDDKKAFGYRPYSCTTQTLQDTVSVDQKQINIIEGTYSMHPTLSGKYDVSVFLLIDSHLQKSRIFERNGADMQKRFIEEWIPMENKYFKSMKIADRCDYIFSESIFNSEKLV